MKSLRNIGLALAVAFGACVNALARAVEPLVRLASKTCTDMACGVERLKHELAHQFGVAPMLVIGVGEGLTREGHGYRQTSASDIAARRTPLSI